jgi:epoxide hydrolase 4
MQSRYLQANGLNFHLKESGEGPLLLLLHGFPEFWYSWSKLIPLLSPHFKVVAPDLRGYGQTDKPGQVRDYHYRTLAKDVAELIRALGYERAIVVGHDWGGAIAWEFAKLYPEMLDRLVVLNCPPAAILQRSMRTNRQQFKMSWYTLFFQLPFLPEWWMHKNRQTFFWRALRGWAINKAAFEAADIARYEEAFAQRSDFTGPVNYYRAAARAVFDPHFSQPPRLQTDTLVIWGEADRALGKWLVQDIAQLEREEGCRLEIKTIADCGHWVQQEQPERVARYILDFVGGRGQAPME